MITPKTESKNDDTMIEIEVPKNKKPSFKQASASQGRRQWIKETIRWISTQKDHET